MLRFVNICLVLGLVALAYVIYQVKYESRGLDAEIASIGKRIDEERDAIAVLRAEWSLLNRPERIERLAHKYLKLAPAKPAQLLPSTRCPTAILTAPARKLPRRPRRPPRQRKRASRAASSLLPSQACLRQNRPRPRHGPKPRS